MFGSGVQSLPSLLTATMGKLRMPMVLMCTVVDLPEESLDLPEQSLYLPLPTACSAL